MTTPNLLPHGVSMMRKHMADHLAEALPPLIDAAREQYELEDWQLPYPLKYNAYDPLSADIYPCVGMFVTNSTAWTRVDINEMAEEVYEARYPVGVFLWVITPVLPDGGYESPQYDAAIRLRDDMTALLRSALLATPSLGSGGAMAVDERTVREDYPDAIKLSTQNDRYAAGGIINCEVRVRQTNYAAPLAVANDVVVEVEPIGDDSE